MGFSDYRKQVLTESAISAKITKNAIDLLNDYIYAIKTDLSEDERKQIVQNMTITIDSELGKSVSMTGVGEFIQGGKYNKQANFSIKLDYTGISDAGVGPDEGGSDETLPDEDVATDEEIPTEDDTDELK